MKSRKVFLRSRPIFPVLLIRIESLLFPRVAAHVIPILLPEAGNILVHEFNSAHPFDALPKIQVRDDQAQWIAMFG